jgi:hypothetical protein
MNAVPLFEKSGNKLISVEQSKFPLEKDLQSLIEANLEEVFSCRFIATEFSTGAQHAGRIDTLALSEENNPVIVEYKKIESSELITQSLYYLNWIQDHRGDFEIATQRQLGRRPPRRGAPRPIPSTSTSKGSLRIFGRSFSACRSSSRISIRRSKRSRRRTTSPIRRRRTSRASKLKRGRCYSS